MNISDNDTDIVQEPIYEDNSSAAPQEIEVPEDSSGAQPEPQAAPTPESDQPVANPEWFKPENFQLKYRGQTVSPKDYQHAVNLMQQGWSYSEAMAQLKKERQELDSRKNKYSDYEKLDQALQNNPAFRQQIWQMYQQAQGQAPQQRQQAPAQQDPQYQRLFQTVSQLQQRLQSWDQQQADQAVQREIEDVKAKLSDVNWDQITETGHSLLYDVLNHAHEKHFPTLMAAARDYLWDSQVANAKMAGAQQVATAKQRAARQGVVSPGANNPVQPSTKKVNVSEVSYDDLAQMALQRLGKS